MTYVDRPLTPDEVRTSSLASLRRLEKKASISMALEMDDALAESLERILQAILELHAVLAGLPAPVVNVAPPAITVSPADVYVPEVDLSSIVTAVTGLKPGADASDIAEAIVNRLQLPSVPDSSGPLAEVAAALEKLEFRMRGMGTQAYGGGSVTLQPNQSVGIANWADMPALEVTTARPAVGTSANVASSATNVTLLAANALRLGATIYNDSTSVLRVKLGATASASSFTVVLAALSSGIGGYYEVPNGFTGIIDGIWASANGSARVTELTA